MTRSELIAALEAATEACRYLDEQIEDNLLPSGWLIPRYTASIDAALKLVPEGYVWRMHPPAVGPNGKWTAETFTQPMWGSCREGKHPTSPAIAICIAALRAREANDDRR